MTSVSAESPVSRRQIKWPVKGCVVISRELNSAPPLQPCRMVWIILTPPVNSSRGGRPSSEEELEPQMAEEIKVCTPRSGSERKPPQPSRVPLIPPGRILLHVNF